jgi:hypothetical protein
VTYRLLAFAGILLILIGAAAAQTSTTLNVPITVTHGGDGGGAGFAVLPPCPRGCTWNKIFEDDFTLDASLSLCNSAGLGYPGWTVYSSTCAGYKWTTGADGQVNNEGGGATEDCADILTFTPNQYIALRGHGTSVVASVPFTISGSLPVPVSGGSCAGYSGSTCPPGFSWTNVIDDEFTGSGSPGNFASDGINWAAVPPTAQQTWPHWYTLFHEGQEWFYDSLVGGYTIADCQDMAYESGGYLHVIGHGSVPLGSGTTANPAYGCEVNTAVNPEPSGGGIYIETYVNYSQAPGYPDFNWMTNNVPSGGAQICATTAGWEADILEVNKSSVFWCWNGSAYSGSTTIGFTNNWQTGLHEIGMQIEDKSGLTIWVDGVQQGSTQNPFGCSSSSPCVQTKPYIMRFTSGGSAGNSTGTEAKFFRVFTHN